MLHSDDFAFSFSGLKTSVRYLLPKLAELPLADVCASFQEAVIDVLVGKSIRAAKHTGHRVLAVSGGVSCNTRLREKLATACGKAGLELLIAEPSLCTDNAGMIGYVGALRAAAGERSELTCDIDSNLRLAV
jgi:N6-L-threonylcarbamoyladenine synthase